MRACIVCAINIPKTQQNSSGNQKDLAVLGIKQVATHHADFHGIEQVKGQCSHQVDDKPCGQVMDAYLSCIKDYLAWLADKSGAKIENYVWQVNKNIKNRKTNTGLVVKMDTQLLISDNETVLKQQPTYDEQDLHGNVTDGRAAGQVIVVTNKAHIIGHRHGNVECGEQNQPIPSCFECAVVQ